MSPAFFGRPVALLIGQRKPVSESVEQTILLAVYFPTVIGNEVQQRKEELLLSYCLVCHENPPVRELYAGGVLSESHVVEKFCHVIAGILPRIAIAISPISLVCSPGSTVGR